MISSELLSEVLKSDIEHFSIHDNYLWIQIDGGYLNKTISIYQLAHKCKEWATNKGYKYKGEDGVVYVYYLGKLVETIVSDKVKNWFDMDIDFKACEWIRTQIAS